MLTLQRGEQFTEYDAHLPNRTPRFESRVDIKTYFRVGHTSSLEGL